jgi:short-subunit dehydrogenase
MNIGTAIAFYLVKRGVKVIMVSRNLDNLKKIKQGLIDLGCKEKLISYIDADITTEDGTKKIVKRLPPNEVIYWVQSIGMGGGTYKLPNDNIYLPFEKIPPELILMESGIAVATHRLMLKMIPIFRKQIKKKQKAKIVIITSMSGKRGYHFGATHVAAKHTLVGYIKGIKNELNDEGIEIYDVRPGGIDTGMYDNPYVKTTVEIISQKTEMWGGRKPIYGQPMAVAKKVYEALFSKNSKQVYRVLAPHQK